MPLLDDLIRSLDADCPVRDIRLGVFLTAVATRGCGLAATLPKDALRQPHPQVARPGSLHEKSARELAAMALSDSILEAAMGMAAINSLLDPDETAMVERKRRRTDHGEGRGQNVVVVGHFRSCPRSGEKAANLWVLENNHHRGTSVPSAPGSFCPGPTWWPSPEPRSPTIPSRGFWPCARPGPT
jgi:hypothetical protein